MRRSDQLLMFLLLLLAIAGVFDRCSSQAADSIVENTSTVYLYPLADGVHMRLPTLAHEFQLQVSASIPLAHATELGRTRPRSTIHLRARNERQEIVFERDYDLRFSCPDRIETRHVPVRLSRTSAHEHNLLSTCHPQSIYFESAVDASAVSTIEVSAREAKNFQIFGRLFMLERPESFQSWSGYRGGLWMHEKLNRFLRVGSSLWEMPAAELEEWASERWVSLQPETRERQREPELFTKHRFALDRSELVRELGVRFDALEQVHVWNVVGPAKLKVETLGDPFFGDAFIYNSRTPLQSVGQKVQHGSEVEIPEGDWSLLIRWDLTDEQKQNANRQDVTLPDEAKQSFDPLAYLTLSTMSREALAFFGTTLHPSVKRNGNFILQKQNRVSPGILLGLQEGREHISKSFNNGVLDSAHRTLLLALRVASEDDGLTQRTCEVRFHDDDNNLLASQKVDLSAIVEKIDYAINSLTGQRLWLSERDKHYIQVPRGAKGMNLVCDMPTLVQLSTQRRNLNIQDLKEEGRWQARGNPRHDRSWRSIEWDLKPSQRKHTLVQVHQQPRHRLFRGHHEVEAERERLIQSYQSLKPMNRPTFSIYREVETWKREAVVRCQMPIDKEGTLNLPREPASPNRFVLDIQSRVPFSGLSKRVKVLSQGQELSQWKWERREHQLRVSRLGEERLTLELRDSGRGEHWVRVSKPSGLGRCRQQMNVVALAPNTSLKVNAFHRGVKTNVNFKVLGSMPNYHLQTHVEIPQNAMRTFARGHTMQSQQHRLESEETINIWRSVDAPMRQRNKGRVVHALKDDLKQGRYTLTLKNRGHETLWVLAFQEGQDRREALRSILWKEDRFRE